MNFPPPIGSILAVFALVCVGNADEVRIAPVGPSESLVEGLEEITDTEGSPLTITNRYTELGNGLNYFESGVWKSTDTTLVTEPGYAKAWKGQHKVTFGADLNSDGSIAIELPDGGRLRSQIYGLAYVNNTTGESVLIASVTNAPAWITEPNRVLYVNAFNEFAADVRYTYTRDGLEQDVILRESPPAPSEFGWNPADVHIEVWTEFIDADQAKSTRRGGKGTGKNAAESEEPVDLGTMALAEGRAFEIGQEQATLAVVEKRWETAPDGRSFLVETVPVTAVATQLEALPGPSEGASLRKRSQIRKFPNRLQAFQSIPKSVRKAGVEQALIPKIQSAEKLLALNSKPGVVLDYQLNLTANQTDYTFKGDTTYYVAGNYTMSGTTTLEGGAVIKFAQYVSGSVDPRIYVSGPLVCKTSAYRPAVFTAKDDNSVGETISGSTGTPTSSPYANFALRLFSTTQAYKVEHLRFCYTSGALSFANVYSNTVANSQFVKCLTPIMNSSAGIVGAYNVLVDSVPAGGYVFNDGGVGQTFYGENLTVHSSPNLRTTASGTTLRLINSLLVNVVNTQTVTMVSSVATPSASGIFQTVLAGRFYLASLSPHRNAGTTSMTPSVLAELKQLTTYPPLLLTGNIGQPTALYPQALRDIDTPDLGYHYPPLDYIWNRMSVTNGALTLTNGVAVAFYSNYGITIGTGGSLVSGGMPNRLNRLTTFNTVQEQPERWISNTLAFNMVSGSPRIGMKFTDVSFMSATINGRSFCTTTHGEAVDIRDSSLRGVYWKFYNNTSSGYTVPNHGLYNNLLDRSEIDWEQGDTSISTGYYLTLTLRNNLFSNSKLTLKRATTYYGTWTIRDNLLAGITPVVNFFTPYDVIDARGTNAYTTGTSEIPLGGSGNKSGLLTDFQTGQLGPWYYPTSGAANSLATLIDGDTIRTPVLAGLYHHTTRSDLAKDGATASQLDIGYHYVATDFNGTPLDQDADGLPDYREDIDGDGVVDSGETSWNAYTSRNGLSGGTSFNVFTPLR